LVFKPRQSWKIVHSIINYTLLSTREVYLDICTPADRHTSAEHSHPIVLGIIDINLQSDIGYLSTMAVYYASYLYISKMISNACLLGDMVELKRLYAVNSTYFAQVLFKEDADYMVPLEYAAINGHTEAVLYLIEIMMSFKGQMIKEDPHGCLSLCTASNVTLALQAVANAVAQAIEHDHPDLANMLLETILKAKNHTRSLGRGKKKRQNERPKSRFETVVSSTLIRASFYGQTNAFKFLLGEMKFFDTEIRNKEGQTALMHAAYNGYDDIAKIICHDCLVTRISPCNGENTEDQSVQENLERHYDYINSRDISGYTALMYASANGHSGIVDLLLESGADAEVRDYANQTALMYASVHGHESVINSLIYKGNCNPNVTDNRGLTALSWASSYGYVEAQRALLRAGADANLSDDFGRTPLIFASYNQDLYSCKLLIQEGNADLRAKDRWGLTPHDMIGYERVSEYLDGDETSVLDIHRHSTSESEELNCIQMESIHNEKKRERKKKNRARNQRAKSQRFSKK
jgi:ankyrin repeat protein